MVIKNVLDKARMKENNILIKEEVIKLLIILILGIVMGFLTKYIDGIPFIGYIGQYFGVWILLGTIIASWNKTPMLGALNVFIFFTSMSISYSYYSAFLNGTFPTEYLFAWYLFTLYSSLCAYFIWYSRGKGLIAALITSFPLAILLMEGYNFLKTSFIPRALDLIFAIILLFILSKGLKQKAMTIFFTAIVFFVLSKVEFLIFLLG